MARVKAMTREEVAAIPDLAALVRDLAAPANAKRLSEPPFIAAVVRELGARRLFEEAFAVVALHVRAWRGSAAIEVLGAALQVSLASGARVHLEGALGHYEKILRRDPSELYWVGEMHADACECAARLGDRERGCALLERLLDHYSPGPSRRELPDHFPIDDPRIAELWRRPAQATLLGPLEAERKRRGKQRRR